MCFKGVTMVTQGYLQEVEYCETAASILVEECWPIAACGIMYGRMSQIINHYLNKCSVIPSYLPSSLFLTDLLYVLAHGKTGPASSYRISYTLPFSLGKS